MFQRADLTELLASFRFKLFLIFTLITACTVTLFSSLHVYNEIKSKRADTTAVVHLLAQRLAISARLPLYAENLQALLQLAREEFLVPEIHAVVISNHNGRVLVHLRRPDHFDSSEIIIQTVEVRNDPGGLSAKNACTNSRGSSKNMIGTVRIERGTAELTQRTMVFIKSIASVSFIFWLTVSFFCYKAF